MASIGTFLVHQTGDVGGAGLSRFHVGGAGFAALSPADCNSVGAALNAMYTSIRTVSPNNLTWSFDPAVEEIDIPTAAVIGGTAMTVVPANVAGIVAGNYAAGMGARGYWHTATVINRRLVRGATFFTPFGATAYGATGDLAGSTATLVANAMNTYIAAIVAATLIPVVYHRPAVGTFTGGQTGTITTGTCGLTPGGMRSRRS